jgi:hypothetical protein
VSVEQFVCECGWRCERPGCEIPPDQHECMWCGADGPTYWNGELTDCSRVIVVVADAPEFPAYRARDLVGQERHAVEVRYFDKPFYIDNENGSGWAKVRFAGGGPRVGHSSLRIERVGSPASQSKGGGERA